MEYLLSHAEYREDIVLYHLLKNVNEPIHYVDVGANDPVIHSVTKFFYDRGASGINIEPQKKYFDSLNKDRPRDVNLTVGISDKAGELTLYSGDALASFDPDNPIVRKNMAYSVPVVTLSDVFDKNVLKDEDIHFLKIDVDGWERRCLEGMDFLRFRPWILCIESALGIGIPYHEDWEELVLGQNYVFLGDDTHINRYYAAAERLHELQEFRQPKELDDIYRVVSIKSYFCDESLLSILQKQRVVLFGAGPVGQAYWQQIQDAGLQLMDWIASRPKKGFPVNTLERLDEVKYDLILIAVRQETTAEHIRKILMDRGVPHEKILWRPPIAVYR